MHKYNIWFEMLIICSEYKRLVILVLGGTWHMHDVFIIINKQKKGCTVQHKRIIITRNDQSISQKLKYLLLHLFYIFRENINGATSIHILSSFTTA